MPLPVGSTRDSPSAEPQRTENAIYQHYVSCRARRAGREPPPAERTPTQRHAFPSTPLDTRGTIQPPLLCGTAYRCTSYVCTYARTIWLSGSGTLPLISSSRFTFWRKHGGNVPAPNDAVSPGGEKAVIPESQEAVHAKPVTWLFAQRLHCVGHQPPLSGGCLQILRCNQ